MRKTGVGWMGFAASTMPAFGFAATSFYTFAASIIPACGSVR
jgi:hypothetical protein